jgi:hypothetical protein
VNEIIERYADPALQHRIDALVARVHAARAEVVDRGLDAVRAEREGRRAAADRSAAGAAR